MRIFIKFCITGFALAVLVVAAVIVWLRFDKSGLPNADQLSLYLREKHISHFRRLRWSGFCRVISYQGIGSNMRLL